MRIVCECPSCLEQRHLNEQDSFRNGLSASDVAHLNEQDSFRNDLSFPAIASLE